MKKYLLVLLFGLGLSAAAMADPAEIMDYYGPVMQKMHDATMNTKPTGNADVDFIRLMIAHHQAAVDMAQIEIKNGQDPQVLQLARSIAANQQIEINSMKGWLDARDQTK